VGFFILYDIYNKIKNKKKQKMAEIIITDPVGGSTTAVRCGANNKTLGIFSIVGSGKNNTNSGGYSNIGGGVNNTSLNTADYSVIGGGKSGFTNANFTVIGGGVYNTSSGCYSSILGGRSNTTTSNARYSSILGGRLNKIENCYSAILGGCSNLLTASGSSILAGSNITGNTSNTAYVPKLNIRDVFSGTPIMNLGLDASGFVVSGSTPQDFYVTGGSINYGTGNLTLNRQNGSVVIPGLQNYTVTGFSYNNANTLSLTSNVTGSTLSATINTMTGLTVNGVLSATTYQNLPTDVSVTGGTYSAGTATFTNNTGGTFNVTGFVTGDTYVTGLTFNTGTYALTIGRNDGVSFTDNLSILASDVTITGGTYNPGTGVGTFTNNTGGTFNVTGFLTGYTDTYLSAATFSAGTLTLTNSDATTVTASGFQYQKPVFNIAADPTDGVLVSGTTTETISKSVLISANTLSTNSILELSWGVYRTGTGLSSILSKVWINSANTLSGAVLLANGANQAALNGGYLRNIRDIQKIGTTGYIYNATQQNSNDLSTTNSLRTTFTINNSTPLYLLFTVICLNSADAASINRVRLSEHS
jgi:hypothetical protein